MTTTATNYETQEQPSTPPGLEPNHKHDYWENVDGKWKRHHVIPRTRLYRPGAEQRPNEKRSTTNVSKWTKNHNVIL